MTEITPKTFPKYKPNPLFATLPAMLKDHDNYLKIQKHLLEKLATKHSHGEMSEWVACPACQRKFYERGEAIRKLGFTSMAQFMAWEKTHQTITKRIKLR